MNTAMRLLYVDNSLVVHGGIERVITDKVNWLVEYGSCDVCLLTVNQGKHPLVYPLNSKVEYYDLRITFHQIFNYPLWKRYFRLFQLRRLFIHRLSERIESFSPDVIVCTRLDYISDVMKVRGGIPVIYEAHNSFLAYKFEHYSLLQRVKIKNWHKALKKVNMIVALTQGDAIEWKKINPNVQVIPNVVHLNDTGLYSECQSKSVIFVGRYTYQKDLDSLLKIWEIVSLRYSDWQLHLLGGYGDQEERLLSDIIRQKANIVIHKPTSFIYEEYLNCSILLMTSRFEPFGLVLPEAMSCGLPVVSFDCPYGPPEIISDGIDGFLIQKRDIYAFAEKLCLLIEKPDLRVRMGRAGSVSSRKYNVEHIMPLWINLFDKYKNE